MENFKISLKHIFRNFPKNFFDQKFSVFSNIISSNHISSSWRTRKTMFQPLWSKTTSLGTTFVSKLSDFVYEQGLYNPVFKLEICKTWRFSLFQLRHIEDLQGKSLTNWINLTFLERIILDKRGTRFLSRWELFRESKFTKT